MQVGDVLVAEVVAVAVFDPCGGLLCVADWEGEEHPVLVGLVAPPGGAPTLLRHDDVVVVVVVNGIDCQIKVFFLKCFGFAFLLEVHTSLT